MIAEKQSSGTLTDPGMEMDTIIPPPAKKQHRQSTQSVAPGPAPLKYQWNGLEGSEWSVPLAEGAHGRSTGSAPP